MRQLRLKRPKRVKSPPVHLGTTRKGASDLFNPSAFLPGHENGIAPWPRLAASPAIICALSPHWLQLIVLIEARAGPRLRTVEGLWRRSTRARAGRLTDFIRSGGLLAAVEVDRIIDQTPQDLLSFQRDAAALPLANRPSLDSWLRQFEAGEAALRREGWRPSARRGPGAPP